MSTLTNNRFQVLSDFIEVTKQKLVRFDKMEKELEMFKVKEILHVYLGML